jgi:hypothetical protein
MLKYALIALAITSAMLAVGCGDAATSNTAKVNSNAAANSNSPAEVKLDPANMPPGLSASPLQQSAANADGISANPAPLPKGTPTPGIPSEAELKKPFKPGATPTPGIPSEAEIRKAMGKTANIKTDRPPANAPPMMMKSTNRKLGGKPE